MNRVKLWVFTLLVVALGYLLVHAAASARRDDIVAALDARLASAAAHVAASVTAAGHDATALAALVARDDALVAALRAPQAAPPAPPPPPKVKGKQPPPPPPPSPAPDLAAQEAKVRDAARAALGRAATSLGLEVPQGMVVEAASREWLARKGEGTPADAELVALLRAAAGGQSRRGLVRQAGALWYGVGRPTGDGSGVALLAPLDESWAKRVATAAGVDVTLAVPEVKPITTAKGGDPAALAAATKLAGAGDVGRPGDVDVSVGPVKLPKLPQPFAGGAPVRARAVAVEGVKGGYAVVSIPAAAAVNAPAAFHWRAVAGLALVLLTGVVLGFFVRSTEPTPQVPEPLLTAAGRIEKGDFAARAPKLAGKLGTIAAALNKAAEIAGPAVAARGAPAALATTDDWYQGPARAAEQADAAAPAVAAAAPFRVATATAAAPALAPPAAPAPAATPTLEVDEETHWQQVFQDFLRTRSSCGEGSEGLTYDRFRQKLEGNKAQLVSKYACKTVRFQVYVKDGKAALKATPVK